MDIALQAKRLKQRRLELVGGVSQIELALDAPMPGDWEDRASERQGDEVLEALGLAEIDEIRRIDAALARIEGGTYGLCLKCGETISQARLATLPEAALCRYCAR